MENRNLYIRDFINIMMDCTICGVDYYTQRQFYLQTRLAPPHPLNIYAKLKQWWDNGESTFINKVMNRNIDFICTYDPNNPKQTIKLYISNLTIEPHPGFPLISENGGKYILITMEMLDASKIEIKKEFVPLTNTYIAHFSIIF
jgi:hypothetical protein